MSPIESRLRVNNTISLYLRSIGHGPPIIVLHGGPDFDQTYLLPDLDRLKDAYRFVYYDQRGRGRSADQVRPEDVTLASELDDLDKVRRHVGVEAPVLLGHSWGTVLALEYALRHPSHVSRLILMNPVPASASGRSVLRTRTSRSSAPTWSGRTRSRRAPRTRRAIPRRSPRGIASISSSR